MSRLLHPRLVLSFPKRLASLLAVGCTAVLLHASSAAAWKDRPLDGDAKNGAALYKKATKTRNKGVRVSGNWINALSDRQAMKGLSLGKGGLPALESDNPLDQHDVIQFIREKNIDLRDLIPEETSHVLIAKGKFDKFAVERLTERANFGDKFEALQKSEKKNRVFVLYDLGRQEGKPLKRVRIKNTRMRDKLKPKKKVGYVVFMPLKGVRDGGYEVAFAVDMDIKIIGVDIVAGNGSRPADLNRAAARLIGRGARGKYQGLRLVGAGKAVRELQKSISRAFLLGMESVYMYEVKERDYFAFDVDDD